MNLSKISKILKVLWYFCYISQYFRWKYEIVTNVKNIESFVIFLPWYDVYPDIGLYVVSYWHISLVFSCEPCMMISGHVGILQRGCVTRTRIVWTEENVRKILWLIHTLVTVDRDSPAVTVTLVSTVLDLQSHCSIQLSKKMLSFNCKPVDMVQMACR